MTQVERYIAELDSAQRAYANSLLIHLADPSALAPLLPTDSSLVEVHQKILRMHADPDSPSPTPQEHRPLTEPVLRRWMDQLIDLTGNNRLINFREFKSSTLPLSPQVLDHLNSHQKILLTGVPDADHPRPKIPAYVESS